MKHEVFRSINQKQGMIDSHCRVVVQPSSVDVLLSVCHSDREPGRNKDEKSAHRQKGRGANVDGTEGGQRLALVRLCFMEEQYSDILVPTVP